MSRGLVPGHHSPWPLLESLPVIYHDDRLAQQLTAAFDDVLAPALTTIDSFSAYLDPALTPDDFVDWLASWVGLLPDETWPIERRRAVVAMAAHLYRSRGTVKGIEMHVKLFTGGDVEVIESGGAAWSTVKGADVPGNAQQALTVRVTQPKKGRVELERIDALVAVSKPAHMPHRVELAGE